MADWISVTARLPSEDDGTVAVLTEDGAILTAWATYWHGASSAFNCWSFPHPDDDDSTVTHWHPLPPVPTAGVAIPTAREYLEQQFPPGAATREWLDGWDSCRQFALGVRGTDGGQQ